MKTTFSMYSNLLNSVVCFTAAILMSGSVINAQSFKVFEVSDLVRVFEDGYKLPLMHDTIRIFGIRGEILSGQCVLNAKNNLTNVTVEVSALKNQVSGNILPANHVEWNFVGSIPLSKNTPNQPLTALIRPAPAKFPDYLMAEKQVNVNKGMWQSIWLTISIPNGAESGTYTGKVTVKSGQGEQSLPVSVIVFPITLPVERHLMVTEWYNTRGFQRFHGIEGQYTDAWFAMLKKYAENMAAHRQNMFQVPAGTIEIRQTKSGALEFDFTRFDQIAQVFWNTGKMDMMETGELSRFGEKGWSGPDILFRDFNVKNTETGAQVTLAGKDVMPLLIPAIESHLRQKGWLSKTLFHIKDEPSIHNALAWCDMSFYIHKYGPDLKRGDAIETTYLLNEIEIAVPKLDAFGTWYDTYMKGQQKGVEIWFYTVGIYQGSLFPNKTIDMPVIDSRIMHWLNYRYNATGYLHWGWNQWTENPFQEVGQHVGDGWHVYPAKDGVLNSLRWEQMRNGIQDYEIFLMLEKKICALKDSLGSRFAWIDPKQRGKEIAGEVVMGIAEHSDDPAILYKAKMEVIKELLDFNTSPRIYVQTDPVVGSTLTNRSSVELFGWTEPGTKVVANGQVLPVSFQGLFLEKISLSPRSNNVRVQASNDKGSKEIIRNFVVK